MLVKNSSLERVKSEVFFAVEKVIVSVDWAVSDQVRVVPSGTETFEKLEILLSLIFV